MKTAKEMFEKLGYNIRPSESVFIVYENTFSQIVFKLDDKVVVKFYRWADRIIPIEVNEHKAIHQQLKELGWIDE